MPCRWPSDSELYREASEQLAQQKWINQEMEEALCSSNTLLIRILSDSENSIKLSDEQQQQVVEIKSQHLEHRVEELAMLEWTLGLDIQSKEEELSKLMQVRITHKSEWFDANDEHFKKEKQVQKQIQTLKEELLKIQHILSQVREWSEVMILKVLTKQL